MAPFYSFLKSANDMFIDDIDDKQIYETLLKAFPESNLKVETKEMLKDVSRMNEFLLKVNFSIEEFVTATVRLFPDIWNHHLVKFVKNNYLNKTTILTTNKPKKYKKKIKKE